MNVRFYATGVLKCHNKLGTLTLSRNICRALHVYTASTTYRNVKFIVYM